ncbi:hypothetical protein GEMRC1_014126 [Eukaryota sp. GEM-RC1]
MRNPTKQTARQFEESLPTTDLCFESALDLFDRIARSHCSSNLIPNSSPTPPVVPPLSSFPFSTSHITSQSYPAVELVLRSFFFPTSQAKELIDLEHCSIICTDHHNTIKAGILCSVEGYIEYVFVDSAFQRQGLASSLIQEMARRFPRLSLHVDPFNSAILLYYRMGFKPLFKGGFCHFFYSKYLPLDTDKCRHAFHLELKN